MRLTFVAAVFTLFAGSLPAQEIYTLGDGVSPPTRVKLVRAYYTEAARAAKIEGNVIMRAVVHTDGRVGDVEVTQSLDSRYGLDQEAVNALRQWEFTPATKDGKPVAVRMTFTTRFTLK